MSVLLNPIEPPKLIKSWINNDAAHGSGRELPVFYPATGEQVSILVEDGPEDVNKAVISARKAFDNTSIWSRFLTKLLASRGFQIHSFDIASESELKYCKILQGS